MKWRLRYTVGRLNLHIHVYIKLYFHSDLWNTTRHASISETCNLQQNWINPDQRKGDQNYYGYLCPRCIKILSKSDNLSCTKEMETRESCQNKAKSFCFSFFCNPVCSFVLYLVPMNREPATGHVWKEFKATTSWNWRKLKQT